jgi:plastocyanin
MRRALPLAAALVVGVNGGAAAAAAAGPAHAGDDAAKRGRAHCARIEGRAARGRHRRCARWSQARAGAAGAAGAAGWSEVATVGSPTDVQSGSGTGSPPPPLPRRLAVDENEYTVFPSRNPVAAGDVEFNVNNFGQDDHDLTITNGTNQFGQVFVAAGTSARLTATLPPGTYKLYCSLLNGLHDGYGMHAALTVQ